MKLSKPHCLTIFYGEVPKNCIGDMKDAVDLGAPNIEKYQHDLYEFLQGENLKYIYNIVLSFPDDMHEKFYRASRITASRLASEFGSYWDSHRGIECMFANVPAMLDNLDVGQIEAIKIKSAILICTGPSLELELETLKQAQARNDILLVSADANFKKLLKHDIVPHLVVTSERFDGTLPFLNEVDPKHCILVCSPYSSPVTIDAYRGRKAFIRTTRHSLDWLPFFTRSAVRTGASVSPVALGAIKLLGIYDIALVGQDLSYSPENGNTHADIEIAHPDFKDGNTCGEVGNLERYLVPGNTIKQVWTNMMWSNFAQHVSTLVDDYNLNITNTSKWGRKIDGCSYQTLSEWLSAREIVKGAGLKVPEANRWKDREHEFIVNKINKAIKTLDEMQIDGLDVRQIIQTDHYGLLAFDMLLRDYVHYMNMCFRHPDMAEYMLLAFRQKAKQARDDILKILRESVNGL